MIETFNTYVCTMCMYVIALMNIVSTNVFNCFWKVRKKISAMIL